MKDRTSIFLGGIEAYIDTELVRRPHPLFFEMEKRATEKAIPIVSAATGAVLQSLVACWRPAVIWELGTGIGYSTLWMAIGSPDSKIYTIDRNGFQASILEEYSERILGVKKDNICRIESWALDYMYQNIAEWASADLIFIDCDKVTYPELWDLISHHIKPGARIVFDNVLWHGRLMNEEFQKPSDLAVRALWNRIKTSDFTYTLFPVGDGILVTEKR